MSLREYNRTIKSSQYPMNSEGRVFTTIQAAINDLGSSGWVFIPAGQYNENLQILGVSVTLEGVGDSSIVNGGSGVAVLVAGNADQATLRNFAVWTSGEQADCIFVSGVHDTRIQSIRVIRSAGAGISIYGGNHAIINDCYVTNASTGIEVGGSGIIVSKNFINEIGGFGIYVGNTGDNSVITSNVIDTTGDDGINIFNASGVLVTSNKIIHWTNECIDDDGNGCWTSGNMCA